MWPTYRLHLRTIILHLVGLYKLFRWHLGFISHFGTNNYYHLPTMLREGNVFTGVCYVTTTHDALDLIVQPPSKHGTWGPRKSRLPLQTWDIWTLRTPLVTSVQTYSLDLTVPDPYLPNLPPPVLTSVGHWSMYSWQAGGTHPTGILSCSIQII